MSSGDKSAAALYAAVRRAAPARVWTQGVKLARDGAVTHESEDAYEVVLRVAAPGRAVAPSVVLYPDDREWDCDCPNSEATCAHVVAAAIALKQARSGERALETVQAAGGRVRYALRRDGDSDGDGGGGGGPGGDGEQPAGLTLERYVITPEGEHRVATTLSALISGRERGPRVNPEQVDLIVDQLLGTRTRGRLAIDRLPLLVQALGEASANPATAPDVTLDGDKVAIAVEPVMPRAVVHDGRRGGARLVIERDPAVDEIVAPGLARCGDTLRPLGAVELTGWRLERLPIATAYPPERLEELLRRVVELREQIDVDIRARHLPRLADTGRPRIELDVEQRGDELHVTPKLVYCHGGSDGGGELLARIDGDRLVHLGGAIPVRDRAAEKKLRLRLRDELDLVPGHRAVFTGHDATAFAARLKTWRGELRDTDRGGEVLAATPLVPRIVTGDDSRPALDVVFELPEPGPDARPGARDVRASDTGGVRRADIADVLAAWQGGFEVVGLLGGGYAPLPMAWLAEHGHLVADLVAAREDDGGLPAYALPDAARLCAALDHPPPPGFDRLRPLVESFDALPEAPLPADLTATLRPYQRRGVSWLAFLRQAGLGGVLADDMGLGKTVQALCAVRGRTLVVCPTSVVPGWSEQTRRFRPALNVSVFHGAGRALDPDADITLTTYNLLRIEIDRLADIEWDAVFLDEAQAIKNPDSQVARAAYRLRARFRLALTGTPVENRLDELWSQLHFANPGLLGGRSAFTDRYQAPIARGDADAAERLRARIRPFILRRLKRDVAPELPPRTEAVLHVELSPDERAVYDAVRAATRTDVLARLGAGGGVLAALEALLRLRQAACHPALVPGPSARSEASAPSASSAPSAPADESAPSSRAPAPSPAPSSKVDRLVGALEEAAADGHKALVFSQWTSLLDLIEPHLAAAGIAWTRLDGSTRDRAGVVAAFSAHDGPPVMLISLKAGGTGLNLTAADHVFLCDPWWNPAVEDQAADRAHRIGQDRPVMVYRLVALDTVEERILALQDRKRALVDVALGGADRAAALTRDDLLALLA